MSNINVNKETENLDWFLSHFICNVEIIKVAEKNKGLNKYRLRIGFPIYFTDNAFVKIKMS